MRSIFRIVLLRSVVVVVHGFFCTPQQPSCWSNARHIGRRRFLTTKTCPSSIFLRSICRSSTSLARQADRAIHLAHHQPDDFADAGAPIDPDDVVSTLATTNVADDAVIDESSKRQMMTFALPALGIYLTNPLLSNIDNVFVGRTVGTLGLAALSPATLCTDQVLYLFSFLGRATTGLVARAYNDGPRQNAAAARTAASAPLTVALVTGLIVSALYAVGTPALLRILAVDVALQPAAASYMYWRGAICAAALAQMVSLSVLMATRDAVTPLFVVASAALINVVLDAIFCVGLDWGVAGAAAATALATLLSCGFMLRALHRKALLPSVRRPTLTELRALLDYTGPLLAITVTRLAGFVNMQRTAMRLGSTVTLAGYQLCINVLMLFLLFGEPWSQLCQTQLPSLLDQRDGAAVARSLRSIATLAAVTAATIGSLSFGVCKYASSWVSSDVGVQAVAHGTAGILGGTVAISIVTITMDGAMLAARDFGFMLALGLSTFVTQMSMLPYCQTIGHILLTFGFRLGTYTVACIMRTALGFGGLGHVLRPGRRKRLRAMPSTTKF